jgi:hypothetical protein
MGVKGDLSTPEDGAGDTRPVDPELVTRFALFHAGRSDTLDERDVDAVKRFVGSPAGRRFRLDARKATKVAVRPDVTVLVVPGESGVSVLMRNRAKVAAGALSLPGHPSGRFSLGGPSAASARR